MLAIGGLYFVGIITPGPNNVIVMSAAAATFLLFLTLLVIPPALSQQQRHRDLSRNRHRSSSAKSSEVFFLNLEDGFFGCQVNESVDFLQLFEISKLCDGEPHCYGGSDESNNKLKCTSKLIELPQRYLK